MGRQARRHRRRGRHRGPADDALLEPLPAQPVSQLGGSRTPGRRARRAGSTRCSPRPAPVRADATQTGAPVVDGKVYVNNGFWDTYRTVWPALLAVRRPTTPASWSTASSSSTATAAGSPAGPRRATPNLMTGTSSDVAFADAYVKGIGGFDATDAYDAGLKNATVAPPAIRRLERRAQGPGVAFPRLHAARASRGRVVVARGLHQRLRHRQHGGQARHGDAGRRPLKRRYQEEREYFRSRATDYVHAVRPGGRLLPGPRRERALEVLARGLRPARLGPRTTTPRPTAGTSPSTRRRTARAWPNLYGGRDGLATKLDEFFSTPETAQVRRLLRRHDPRDDRGARRPDGPVGISNQPSHHIPYMYDYAGQPCEDRREGPRGRCGGCTSARRSARATRGDEDNGETSAWYLFSALGLYPLQVGSDELRDRLAAVQAGDRASGGGKDIVVSAPEEQREERLRPAADASTARRSTATWLRALGDRRRRHARVRHGPAALEVGHRRGRRSAVDHARATKVAEPLRTRPATRARAPASGSAGKLSDDDSSATASPGAWAQYRFAAARQVSFYTLPRARRPAVTPPAGS